MPASQRKVTKKRKSAAVQPVAKKPQTPPRWSKRRRAGMSRMCARAKSRRHSKTASCPWQDTHREGKRSPAEKSRYTLTG